MNRETRWFETKFECRADDKGKHILGRPVIYDQKTDLEWFFEIIEKDALKDTDLRDVLFFVNHDISKLPLARSRNNNDKSTMKIAIDDDGLSIDATIDTEENSESRNLYSAVSRGDISGMSFMFEIGDEEWEDLDTEKPLRRIKKISTIIEVSAVNFPAYPQTEIEARSKETLDSVLRRSLDSDPPPSPDREDKEKLMLEKLKVTILTGGQE
jgi:HK97 family phage prohead protease